MNLYSVPTWMLWISLLETGNVLPKLTYWLFLQGICNVQLVLPWKLWNSQQVSIPRRLSVLHNKPIYSVEYPVRFLVLRKFEIVLIVTCKQNLMHLLCASYSQILLSLLTLRCNANIATKMCLHQNLTLHPPTISECQLSYISYILLSLGTNSWGMLSFNKQTNMMIGWVSHCTQW